MMRPVPEDQCKCARHTAECNALAALCFKAQAPRTLPRHPPNAWRRERTGQRTAAKAELSNDCSSGLCSTSGAAQPVTAWTLASASQPPQGKRNAAVGVGLVMAFESLVTRSGESRRAAAATTTTTDDGDRTLHRSKRYRLTIRDTRRGWRRSPVRNKRAVERVEQA